VKFQFNEIVDHPDANLVLNTLKGCLRDISLEITQAGDQLTIYGLGPSFRTMNRNDTATLRATSQGTATVLDGEVSFLASALMGDMPQDSAVRSKIEQAIRCLRIQLNLDNIPRQVSSSNGSLREPEPPARIEVLTPFTPPISSPVLPDVLVPTQATAPAKVDVAPVSLQEPEPPAPVEVLTPFTPATPSPIPSEVLVPTQATQSVKADVAPQSFAAHQSESAAIEPIEPEEPKAPESPATAVAASFEPPAPVPNRRTAPPVSLPSPIAREESVERGKRSAILPLALSGLLILCCGAYFLQHRSLLANHLTVNQPKASLANPVPAPDTRSQQPSPPADPVQTTPVDSSPKDVKAWVQDWAAAMSTPDVQAQLSFYTDPLDRYFLRSNVSKIELLRDKQAEIKDRTGVWVLKAEDVVIDQQTESKAVIRLIKHITVTSPTSSIQEQRIKTQLKLKLIDGNWKITSERTIG
jgi:ketosteroid isomerase-like protein